MRKPGSRAFTLIEVSVSAVVLGVVAISYAAFYRSQDAQRVGQERLVYAMEIANRQIEYLRQADERLPATDPNASPFASGFQGAKKPPVTGAGPGAFVPEGTFLVGPGNAQPVNSFAFSSDVQGRWRVA